MGARAVHEDELPGPCLFLEEGRFQPVLARGARGVGDAAFIDIGDPSGVAADVDVRFGHVPFIALARGMLCLDEGHDGVSVESSPNIEYVKIRCNDVAIELEDGHTLKFHPHRIATSFCGSEHESTLRATPSFFIRKYKVERFKPKREAAPLGPERIHRVSFRVLRIWLRWTSSRV